MILIHKGTDYSCTNMFELDYDIDLVDGGAKKIIVIKNIKKLFNFECNSFVTLNVGDILTAIIKDKAYECKVVEHDKLMILNNLNINITNTLNELKNGK